MAKRTTRARMGAPGTLPGERPFMCWDPDEPLPTPPPTPTPSPVTMPFCGIGRYKQVDIHKPDDPPKELFRIPDRRTNMYFPELVALTRKINMMFRREAVAGLRRRRRELRLPKLELTIALYRGGVYLTYALPVKGTRGR